MSDVDGASSFKPRVYLNDGISKVDFILLFKDEQEENEEEDKEKRDKRYKFCKSLKNQGLVLEPDITEQVLMSFFSWINENLRGRKVT